MMKKECRHVLGNPLARIYSLTSPDKKQTLWFWETTTDSIKAFGPFDTEEEALKDVQEAYNN